MKLLSFILFLLLFQSPLKVFSQSQDSLHPTRFDKYYIYSGIFDAHDQAVAPFHWNTTQWLTCGTIAIVECGMIFGGGDKNLQSYAQQHRNSTTNFIEDNIGDPFGDGLYPGIIIGTSYLVGCISHNNHIKHMAMLTAKSVVISGATTFVLQALTGRHDPYEVNNPKNWSGPGNLSYDSYPSEHTTLAFSTATMIALEYPRPIIIPIAAYSLATVTALGRINGNYHWGSDILMGAAIGYFTSRLIFRHNNWDKCRKL